jgi:hypothetical protein
MPKKRAKVTAPRKPRQADLWREYERRKRAYEFDHPDTTPVEWQAAIQRIVKELGI